MTMTPMNVYVEYGVVDTRKIDIEIIVQKIKSPLERIKLLHDHPINSARVRLLGEQKRTSVL
ncbi:hypothetical protein GCM10025859_35070 [Alicyclobacillus fastidiosus]|nr:hypothetical protein GCM10025859_35070 [Alicyclobacillus fastidiosus]